MPPWQREEVEVLTRLLPMMCAALATTPLASQYLAGRGLPVEVAQAGEVGYLSRVVCEQAAVSHEVHRLLARWVDRLIFPLSSSQGPGFIGRTLVRWQPGMDENRHKAVLEQPGAPRRWIKTNPAGWYGYDDPTKLASTLILVEGCFDRLALLSAGFPAERVVALAGTAARPLWLRQDAPQVRRVVLALDADAGGTTAMEGLAPALRKVGFLVECCVPSPVAWGKDWNEQWRRRGWLGLQPLARLFAAAPSSGVSDGFSAHPARAPPSAILLLSWTHAHLYFLKGVILDECSCSRLPAICGLPCH